MFCPCVKESNDAWLLAIFSPDSESRLRFAPSASGVDDRVFGRSPALIRWESPLGHLPRRPAPAKRTNRIGFLRPTVDDEYQFATTRLAGRRVSSILPDQPVHERAEAVQRRQRFF